MKKINRSYTFCFVRHPWDWIRSYYRFRRQKEWPQWGGIGEQWRKFGNSNWHPCEPLYSLPTRSFNAFLDALLSKRPGFVHELFSWYTGDHVDFVGKQENLEADLIKALDQAGIPVDAERVRSKQAVNVSERKQLEVDPDLKQAFHRVEYPTLVRYGYQPDEANEDPTFPAQ
jgi:hypothetical protein